MRPVFVGWSAWMMKENNNDGVVLFVSPRTTSTLKLLCIFESLSINSRKSGRVP